MSDETDMSELESLRASTADGRLPAYAWPGGYPIVYLTRNGLVLCPDCANKPEDEYGDPAVAGDVFWEGAPMECGDCGRQIESAYGDPNETSDDQREGSDAQ
jgi:hypothetical protein